MANKGERAMEKQKVVTLEARCDWNVNGGREELKKNTYIYRGCQKNVYTF